ncbi:MAG TPA: serine hydrolase domain-containing protein, partial [Terriglobales bacterium]|nr:serine hydrolase domain-containing protein [Terriglobales bacterium]
QPSWLRTSARLAVLILLWSNSSTGGRAGRTQQADAIFADLKSDHAPGAAVLVLEDGQAVFERGYGVTNLRTRDPIDAHANFRLASVTKQFTAMAVMLLVQDGKLTYETRLTNIFPDFPEYGRSITIRNLLHHTSGLPDYEDLMAPQDPNVPAGKMYQISDDEVLQLLKRQTSTKFAPGYRWRYSNSGYVVLGLLVQKVSGVPFGTFLHDRIFAPLHMDHTILYEKGKNEVSHRAYGHTKTPAGWQETDQSPTSATLGDGGVYSSVADLAKWDQALREHRLLSDSEMRAAVSPVNAPGVEGEDGEPAEYGFGWFLNPYKGHARMWHYGESMGFRTAIERFVADKLTVVVLANRVDLNANELALKVADVYLR